MKDFWAQHKDVRVVLIGTFALVVFLIVLT
jgi:hypothetical protein